MNTNDRFGALLNEMARDVVRHADAEALTGLRRSVFIARGGHAVGEVCRLLRPKEHSAACVMSGTDECVCEPLPAPAPESKEG